MPTPTKADQIARLRQLKYSDGSSAVVATPVYEPISTREDREDEGSEAQSYTHYTRTAPQKKHSSDKRKPRNAIESPDRQDFLIRAIARDVVAALKDLAAAQDRSVNWLAIHLLTEYVEAHS